MRTLFLILFTQITLTSFAQKKPEGQFGVHLMPFFKGEEMGIGGQLGILLPFKGAKIGATLAPTDLQKAKHIMWLATADLRLAVAPNIDLTLQPGYNFYRKVDALEEVKGGFAGAGGFTFNGASKKGRAHPFLQLKYNYFTFQSTLQPTPATRINTRATTISSESSAFTFAFGVSF